MEILGVTESVVKYIREKIITGEFKPGQKLNEVVISNSINVSRPPLREAFRILEHERLVVNVSRKGTYVTKFTKENLEEVYQAREMIECFSIDLLKAKNIKDFSKIEDAITHISLLDPKEKIKSLEAFNQFHIKLIESTDNSLLIHFYRALHSNLARYQFFFLDRIIQYSFEDHQEIYRYLKEREFEKAKELLRIHIRKFLPFAEVKTPEGIIDLSQSYPSLTSSRGFDEPK
jgi:DNA-binding GntR family transcriptional regulator